ncbi:MAG: SIMPL domain-containing protein [Acidobacteriota bacterium]|nr:SIMPL domain-containing protein [Acidobacteriota bacterium]
MKLAWFLLFLMTSSAAAQIAGTTPRPLVRATGEGSVSITPDQARIHVSAVTQASTAQDAASQNASTTANILSQLTQTLGGSGTVQTVGYSVSPNYNYPQGSPAVLTGYTVTNSLEAILNDLTITGKIIDAATQAGATRIDSLQFTLKDDSAARAQALRAATQKAKSKADAMAASLGLKLGTVIVIQESGAVVTPLTTAMGASTAATPIQLGQLNITGNVTIEMELIP